MATLKSNLLFGPLVPTFKRLLSNQVIREFLAESTGTFILLIHGFASHVTYKGKNQKDIFASAFSFGVGALIGVSLSLDVSGAHLNPAVTTAMASIGRLPWKKVPHYFAAQYIGAFASAFVIWLCYGDVIQNVIDPQFQQNGSEIYVPYPGEGVTLFAAFLDQVLSTGMLTLSILAVDGPKLPRPVHPIYFNLVITGLIIAFNYNAGAILNPARDLGPRIFCAIIGYGSVFYPLQANFWWLIGIVGPHLGGIIGVWFYILFIDPDVAYEKDTRMSESQQNQALIVKPVPST